MYVDLRYDNTAVFAMDDHGEVHAFPWVKNHESTDLSEWGVKFVPVSGREGVKGFEVQPSCDHSSAWRHKRTWNTEDKAEIFDQING